MSRTAVAGGAGRIIILATFEKSVHLQDLNPDAKMVVKFDGTRIPLSDVTQDVNVGTVSHIVGSGDSFGADDVVIDAFDNDGRNLGQVTLSEVLLAQAADVPMVLTQIIVSLGTKIRVVASRVSSQVRNF